MKKLLALAVLVLVISGVRAQETFFRNENDVTVRSALNILLPSPDTIIPARNIGFWFRGDMLIAITFFFPKAKYEATYDIVEIVKWDTGSLLFKFPSIESFTKIERERFVILHMDPSDMERLKSKGY